MAALSLALSGHQLTNVAAVAVVSVSTARRAYAGAKIESTTRTRICAAAKQLGLPQPPEASSIEKKAA